IRDLRRRRPDASEQWIEHLRSALCDLRDITATVRGDCRHCIMRVEYASDLTVPAWLVSDGTLRLLALTLLAYYPWDEAGAFMIEEPENGVHPGAIETVLDSLRSMWDHQVLLATHSPALLWMATTGQVPCFARDVNGNTDIVAGEDHPRLTA
ncbi:MAG TPA: AAA family ATPase, partial [Armatimonadota bacterium]|nr:AAA family ATPase [Armatimonadota bacterium]